MDRASDTAQLMTVRQNCPLARERMLSHIAWASFRVLNGPTYTR